MVNLDVVVMDVSRIDVTIMGSNGVDCGCMGDLGVRVKGGWSQSTSVSLLACAS